MRLWELWKTVLRFSKAAVGAFFASTAAGSFHRLFMAGPRAQRDGSRSMAPS